MCSNSRRTLVSLLRTTVLPFVVASAVTVASVALVLGARGYLDREGEMALPDILSEYLWIGAWVLLASLVALTVGYALLVVLARMIARPISRLAEAAERAAGSNESERMDERIDLDELHRLAVSFNHLLDERERKSEEIRNLSRNVLHDLRSPLCQIYEEADRLAHDLVGKEEAALTIQSISRSLTRIVETNAEISRNYSGRDDAPVAELDLAEIVRDMSDMYEAAAEVKRIAWCSSIPSGNILITGHESKIRRLIGNLVDNAIKYTPEGGRVLLTLAQTQKGVRIEVADTGLGMTQADRDNMYERFYRSAAAAKFPGTGLGLSMVHSIVAFYRGDIACDSAVGRGSVFTVTLPL